MHTKNKNIYECPVCGYLTDTLIIYDKMKMCITCKEDLIKKIKIKEYENNTNNVIKT